MIGEIDRIAITLRIQHLIKVAGGQAAFARQCELPESTIEYWLQSSGLPGSVALAKIARGCKVSAHWILFGKDRA